MRAILSTVIAGAVMICAGCKSPTTATTTPKKESLKPATTAARTDVSERTVSSGEPQKNTAVARILANTLGGGAGIYMSEQMDALAMEIGKKELQGGRILRIGEGIKITYDGSVMFAGSSSELSEKSKTDLRRIASTLVSYNNTRVFIEAHTDGAGSEERNFLLSQARAKAVADFFVSGNMDRSKIDFVGYGEKQPLFSNATEEGKRQNRRVEIVIIADESLRAQAKKGS